MLAVGGFASPTFAEPTLLQFGRVIDGTGRVFTDATVVIDGDRVISIGPAPTPLPAGARVVDLRRFTAVPGLIDLHTHMTYFWDEAPGTRPLGQPPRATAVTVFLAQANARRTLESGVTTVRDLGAQDFADIAMRDLIERGAMMGPRMFVAGHGLGITRGLPRPGAAPGGRADGIDAARHALRPGCSS